MPRKNIFTSKKLALIYYPRNQRDKKPIVLIKDNNLSGSRYDVRGAYNLSQNIYKELKRDHHEMEFNLEDFVLSDQTDTLIENYKRNLEKIL